MAHAPDVCNDTKTLTGDGLRPNAAHHAAGSGISQGRQVSEWQPVRTVR